VNCVIISSDLRLRGSEFPRGAALTKKALFPMLALTPGNRQ